MPSITYFGYNAFIVRDGNTTVCIDPGRNLKWNRLNSLIPEDCWSDIDLILLTHEHDDHSDYAVDVAKNSSAALVCHEQLAERYESRLGKSRVIGLLPGQAIEIEPRIEIETFRTVHGKLRWKVLGREFAIQPGCHPLGFRLSLGSYDYLNFGDSVFLEEWSGTLARRGNTVLMVPCGRQLTMGPDDASRVVGLLHPDYVIPCHYNWHILFYSPRVSLTVLEDTCAAVGAEFCKLAYGGRLDLHPDRSL